MFCFILKAFIFVYVGPGKGPLCRHHPGADRWVWRGALWWHVFSWSRTSAMWALPAGGSGRAGGVSLYLLHYGGKNWPWRWRTTAISANCWSCSECARTWRTEKACITSMTSSKAFSSSTAQRSSKSCSPKNASWMWSDVWSSILRYPNHGGIESSSPPRHGLKRSFPFQTRSCGRRFTRRTECSIFRTWCCPPPLSLKKTCSPPCTPSSSSTKWRLLACCRWVFVLNHV